MNPIEVPDLFLKTTGRSLPDWLSANSRGGRMPFTKNFDFRNVNQGMLRYDRFDTQKPYVTTPVTRSVQEFNPPELPAIKIPKPAVAARLPNYLNTPQRPSAYQSYAKSKLGNYGWNDSEWGALYNLWQKESGWRNVPNPTSSARGIAQTLMSIHFNRDPKAYGKFDKGWELNPKAQEFLADPTKQIDWGMNYIRNAYGSPSRALQFHIKNNYY